MCLETTPLSQFWKALTVGGMRKMHWGFQRLKNAHKDCVISCQRLLFTEEVFCGKFSRTYKKVERIKVHWRKHCNIYTKNEKWRWINLGNRFVINRPAREKSVSVLYKVVQIWPGLFVCKQVTVCPGHIWTTLYLE